MKASAAKLSSSVGAHTVPVSLWVTSMICRRSDAGPREPEQQVRARLVHELDVLDDEHRRCPARLV